MNENDVFYFESFGVPVRVKCPDDDLFKDAQNTACRAMVGNFRLIEPVDTPHSYHLYRENDIYVLDKDGDAPKRGNSKDLFLKNFDAALRLTIAEYAVDRLFVHAGVVGWRGKAIVVPGNSFTGKTSLIHELVRCGAEYFSDEYAVFDKDGLVYPFARKLAIRSRARKGEVIEMTYVAVEEIGGFSATRPLRVGFVLLTEFQEGSVWRPELLSPGKAVLEMLSQTIPIRYKPKFSLEILKKVTANAIILKSCRPDALEFSEMFLEFIDNKAF